MSVTHATSHLVLTAAHSIDEEEEIHVKLALRQTLDSQVARKTAAKKQAKQNELEQQQHALNCVALEMQEKRTRDFVQKEEQKVRHTAVTQPLQRRRSRRCGTHACVDGVAWM